MRMHAEVVMIDSDNQPVRLRALRWVVISLAGFVAWSAVIAAFRQVLNLLAA